MNRCLSILIILTIVLMGFLGSSPLNLNAQEATPSAKCTTTPRFSGTFLQPYLGNEWTPEQWITEFNYMKDVCITQLIIQWTADSKASTTVYPTKMEGFTQSSPQDVIGMALTAADTSGIDVYLGLQISDEWWNKYANDAEWLNKEATVAKNLADELWSLYKDHPSFKGWYLSFEPDNFNFAGEATWAAMSKFYTDVGDHLRSLAPDKPLMIAPFYNVSGGQTPAEWQKMWAYILAHAKIDIVAMQDGVGVAHATAKDLPTWFEATKNAITESKANTQLWVDAETFNTDWKPMALKGMLEDLKAVEPYVSNYVSFSFNHYLSPQQVNPLYYQAYKNYVEGGALDETAPSTPADVVATAVDAENVELRWSASTDDAGVVAYRVYRNGSPLVTLYQDSTGHLDSQLDPETAYEYQVTALDVTGNESPQSNKSSAKTAAAVVYATNLALHKAYTTSLEADANYVDVDGKELTDSVLAVDPNFTDAAWQARNTDVVYNFTIDLGQEETIHQVVSRFLQDTGPGIYLPAEVKYSVSTDNATFTDIGVVKQPAAGSNAQIKKYVLSGLDVKARYVRVEVTPSSAAWTFIDEIEVRQ